MRKNNENLIEIASNLADELKVVYKDNLKSVILYGSVARGTDNENSDIDILVLVDVPKEKLKGYEDALCDVSTDFALEYLRVFSIIDVTYEEYKEWKNVLPFYKNIEREGIILYGA